MMRSLFGGLSRMSHFSLQPTISILFGRQPWARASGATVLKKSLIPNSGPTARLIGASSLGRSSLHADPNYPLALAGLSEAWKARAPTLTMGPRLPR
jgi:hypothetical protein